MVMVGGPVSSSREDSANPGRGGVFRTFRKGEINGDFSNSSESSTKSLPLQGLPSGFLS